MTENVENLMLEILKRLQADMADVKRELANNNLQIALLGQHVGALTTAVYSGRSDLEDFKRRIERIERRLDLVDPAH
ncbi:MAG TPA: hypothetical protein PL166_11920 [Candidatus Contendobacter sp.]|nr:hypothetical protein [Candidatus Contendobacter sp.]HRD50288.1 hypothetical protein [Candidatus Contendobacter sp.]